MIKLLSSNPDYAELFLQWRNQVTTIRHNPLLHMNIEDCRKRLAAEGKPLSEIWSVPAIRWFVEIDGSIVGNVSLKNINQNMFTAEIAYGIGEDYQGRGYGKQAVSLLLSNAFQETELRKIVAHVHDKNIPSLKLLDRIGFKREGLLREQYLINGEPANEFAFGMLKREWLQINYSP